MQGGKLGAKLHQPGKTTSGGAILHAGKSRARQELATRAFEQELAVTTNQIAGRPQPAPLGGAYRKIFRSIRQIRSDNKEVPSG